MKIIFSTFLLIILACTNKSAPELTEKREALQNQINPAINSGIKEIESINFRRTYVGHENLSDKELDKLYKSNPSLETYDIDSGIVNELNDSGLLKKTELILHHFENKKLTKEYLDDKNEILIACKYDSLSISKIDITIGNGAEKNHKALDFGGDHIIGIILKDVDDDDIKEILILTNYYVMNGDNFQLKIFKYK